MTARPAFTLIEMLVVITVIAILAGLIVAAYQPLRQLALKQRSLAIMQTVQQALDQRRGETGGTTAAAAHPLAASAAPRWAFVRAGGGAVSTAGMALRGITPAQIAAGGDRVLLDDDCFADRRSPLLYGMPRRQLGVLGAQMAGVEQYRRLPEPRSGTTQLTSDAGGTDLPISADLWDPSAPGDDANERLIAHVLGSVAPELIRSGVLEAPPDQAAASLICGGRLWSAAAWRNGVDRARRSRVSETVGGTPIPYLLRGRALYDAWGREVLFAVQPGGALRLVSAGRDGCFRWDPGPDGNLQTDAHATDPAGDDRDGARDNPATAGEG